MFSASSITVCSGLSSSGADGQENYAKQAMVGATLLVLPVQLLLVSNSYLLVGTTCFSCPCCEAAWADWFFWWAPSWWACVPEMVAPRALLGPCVWTSGGRGIHNDHVSSRLHLCKKKPKNFFSYFCKIGSIFCFECFILLFRGCGFLCLYAPITSQCWAQVLTIKLEPSVRSGTGGGEEGEVSLPKIWLKIKLLDFQWQLSSSCLPLFTFPWDLKTRAGPVRCSSRWTCNSPQSFTSLLGLGWGTSGGLISQPCRFVAFLTELLSEEMPIDICYWFFVWRENWNNIYIYIYIFMRVYVCVYIFLYIRLTEQTFLLLSHCCILRQVEDLPWLRWWLLGLFEVSRAQKKMRNGWFRFGGTTTKQTNRYHISNLPSPPTSKCAF